MRIFRHLLPFVLLGAIAVAITSPAQADTLNVGPANFTYSSSSATRGYWYVAPIDHTITALRVPNITSEVQNIQVVRFNGNTPPPVFPTDTSAHTTLFYTSTGSSANNWVSVSIQVFQGEVIGILGARGTSTMNNPYGGGNPYSTTMGGQAVDLNRLVYQANLHNGQAGDLSTETGGSYSRVEMTYTAQLFVDADGDGDPETTDCDDADPANWSIGVEICDGADND